MIAITFALPTESSGLCRKLCDGRSENDLLLGKLENRDVAVLHTGVGITKCSSRMEQLLHKARPRLVISSGFAGAVSNNLRIGDLILAENFSDPGLLQRAKEILSGRNVSAVKLFTAASIIDSIEERNKITRESDAAAVDMETGSISEICRVHGVPVLSLRAISDTPNDPLPAPPGVLFDLKQQRTNYGGLFAYLLTHPAALPRLIGFGREINRIRAQLTGAIIELTGAL